MVNTIEFLDDYKGGLIERRENVSIDAIDEVSQQCAAWTPITFFGQSCLIVGYEIVSLPNELIVTARVRPLPPDANARQHADD